ncbi:MAG: HAD family hydrolase [Opitutaceae bacterium]|nr:HAD family hydrolase [Opitutaceae bacterium]
MNRPHYRHIIWDWNGTILDDLDLCVDVMNGLLRRRGLPPMDMARYHALFDFPVRSYYERLGFDFSRDSFEDLSIEFISAYDARSRECRLHNSAGAVLAAIQAAGVTQSVLSAHRQETLRDTISHFGLASFFIRLTGLDNIYAHGKTELGRAWVAELGLPGEEVLMIGDTLHDLDVAQEMGVDCVLVAIGHHPEQKLRRRTDRVLSSLAALPTVPGIPQLSV